MADLLVVERWVLLGGSCPDQDTFDNVVTGILSP